MERIKYVVNVKQLKPKSQHEDFYIQAISFLVGVYEFIFK